VNTVTKFVIYGSPKFLDKRRTMHQFSNKGPTTWS